jgi:hypothetical protein
VIFFFPLVFIPSAGQQLFCSAPQALLSSSFVYYSQQQHHQFSFQGLKKKAMYIATAQYAVMALLCEYVPWC